MFFRLGTIFGDGMVIQRNKPVRIFGEAYSDITLEVCFDGIWSIQKISEGPFIFCLPPHRAATGLELYFRCSDKEISIRDIACGEVWIASGQSNMAMSLKDTWEYKEDQSVRTESNIRFYTVGRNSLPSANDYGEGYEWVFCRDSGWLYCDDDSAPYFSAVGYHFAVKLFDELKVPVGVISCNAGGSNMFSWMSEKTLSSDEDFRRLRALSPVENAYDEDLLEFRGFLDEYKDMASLLPNVAGTAGELPLIYFEQNERFSFKRPFCLYDSMLSKISTYSVKGMIWYQGESEAFAGISEIYAKILSGLTEMLKEDSGESNYAFEFVQIAPWKYDGILQWENICNEQRKFALSHPKYGMITTGDCGGGEDIHPQRKKVVGTRLALAVLNNVYSVPAEYCGPLAEEAVFCGGTISIRFSHCSGMHIRKDDIVFDVINKDGSAIKIMPEISGDHMLLRIGDTVKPVSVRYEFRRDYDIGLYNDSGFPASLFEIEVVDKGAF